LAGRAESVKKVRRRCTSPKKKAEVREKRISLIKGIVTRMDLVVRRYPRKGPIKLEIDGKK